MKKSVKTPMKKIVSKAKQYESKSSLNGKMSYLKGNVKRNKI